MSPGQNCSGLPGTHINRHKDETNRPKEATDSRLSNLPFRQLEGPKVRLSVRAGYEEG
jgi:hypothetical protein